MKPPDFKVNDNGMQETNVKRLRNNDLGDLLKGNCQKYE